MNSFILFSIPFRYMVETYLDMDHRNKIANYCELVNLLKIYIFHMQLTKSRMTFSRFSANFYTI